MFEIFTTIYTIGVVISLAIALLLFFNSRNQPGVIFMAYAATMSALWNLSAYMHNTVIDQYIAITFNRLQYESAILISISFLYFSLLFLGPVKVRSILVHVIVLMLTLAISYITIFTDGVVASVGEVTSGFRSLEFGEYYQEYSIFIFTIFSWTFFNLSKKYKTASNPVERQQLKVLLLGTVSAVVIDFVLALVLPYLGIYGGYWYGPVLPIVFFLFVTYSILKHHLFNIQIPIGEVLVFVLAISSFIQILVAETPLTRGIAVVIFIITLIISWLLMRSMFGLIKRDQTIKEMLEAKTDFLHIASHQLKTPLSVILGTVDVLTDVDVKSLSDKELNTLLRGLENKTEKLNVVVSDMLDAVDVNPSDTPDENIYNEKVSVREGLLGAIKTYKPRLDKKELGLKVSIDDPEEKYYIASLPIAIYRIISIALDNAIRYTKEGSIHVRLYEEAGRVVISIEDTGIGLNDIDKDKVFDRFERGKEAASLHTDGSGIGLHVARKILARHNGGKISVEAGKDKGTKVTISVKKLEPKAK